MKTLFLFLSLLIFNTSSQAQTSDSSKDVFTPITTADSLNKMNGVSNKMLKEKHNASLIEQVTKFIAENIQYPEELMVYNIEGTVVVKLSINDIGTVEKYEIVKGLDSKLDSVVISQMKNFSKVALKESRYLGHHNVHVPVSFSFDH